MFYSKKHRLMFFHVGKTGGTSVAKALVDATGVHNQPFAKHIRARDLKALMKPWVWNRCFKFVFVRNPWDRVVSKYHYIHQLEHSDHVDKTSRSYWRALRNREKYRTFGQFLTGPMRPKPQYEYTHDDLGRCIVDFVGRYENLAEDMREVGRRVGLNLELPHVNRSRHHHYREHFDVVTRNLVRWLYRRDIDLFDYDF